MHSDLRPYLQGQLRLVEDLDSALFEAERRMAGASFDTTEKPRHELSEARKVLRWVRMNIEDAITALTPAE